MINDQQAELLRSINDFSIKEIPNGSANAINLDELERLKLVESTRKTVGRNEQGYLGAPRTSLRLTDLGCKYFLEKELFECNDSKKLKASLEKVLDGKEIATQCELMYWGERGCIEVDLDLASYTIKDQAHYVLFNLEN